MEREPSCAPRGRARAASLIAAVLGGAQAHAGCTTGVSFVRDDTSLVDVALGVPLDIGLAAIPAVGFGLDFSTSAWLTLGLVAVDLVIYGGIAASTDSAAALPIPPAWAALPLRPTPAPRARLLGRELGF